MSQFYEDIVKELTAGVSKKGVYASCFKKL